ncbi:MAG: iron-sulfur cluster assembly accessory protein [Candidatus Altiarchaeales archaeon]|nr:iron-sulfur cluster assembly accessory protein [Candidatus Altiarchaeales archaeon]
MEVISLTEKAQAQAKELLDKESEPKDGLRIAVIGGGCSGLQYKLGWDNAKETDEVQEYPNGLAVLVDPKSAEFLKGCSLEFHDSIEQTGFEVQNPNASSCCGCGKSFCA